MLCRGAQRPSAPNRLAALALTQSWYGHVHTLVCCAMLCCALLCFAVLCCAVLPSGPVERQVQDIKLGPAAVAARRPSTEAIPTASGLSAGSSPRPSPRPAEDPCSCSATAQRTDDSSRVSCSSSSSDVTPPMTERRAGMQQALPAVKAKIIELVRPMNAMLLVLVLWQT